MSKVDQYAEIFEMLLLARKTLKYPSIRFTTEEGIKVALSLATKGYIAVKLDGEYQGKIPNKDSDLIFYPKNEEKLKKEIEVFASFPKYQTVLHGQRTGTCCFCGRPLVEKASVYYGYGPICAENFGLPHELSEAQIKQSKEEIQLAGLDLSGLDDPEF
jgi:hypothetical protein